MRLIDIVVAVVSLVTLTFAGGGGIGDYKYTDKQDASIVHPGNPWLPVNKVPMLICLGFDDNGIAAVQANEGASWILNYLKTKKNPAGNGITGTYDGTLMRATFYMTAKYGLEWVYEDYPDVRRTWKNLHGDGHEIGNHSTEHLMKYDPVTDSVTNYDGKKYTQSEWSTKEVDPCHTLLTKAFNATVQSGGIGIPAKDIWGWRTPRLEWNNNLFVVLKNKGFVYDCSIEETSADGQTFHWPYTLDNGSPANDTVTKYPGLWEMPAYNFMIPPHLQGPDKVGAKVITGLDYNIWVRKDWGGKQLTAPEFTDILVYTLKQRMAGNRAPFLVGLHSDIYATEKNSEYPGTGVARNRQKAIENFIDSAVTLYPEAVRFVAALDIIKWMRKPVGLDGNTGVDEIAVAKPSALKILGTRDGILTIQTPSAGAYTLTLYSLRGTLIDTYNLTAPDAGIVSFDGMKNLASGPYCVELKGAKASVTERISVQ